MHFPELLASSPLILSECAIAERLRRQPEITLHPLLFNTPLIRNEKARQQLAAIYREYRDIARKANLPILLCAPTWRVDKVRLEEAGFSEDLLYDAIAFINDLCAENCSQTSPCITGALIAPKNDCYQPAQALSRPEAREFHGWQLKRIARDPVDVVIAQTFPAFDEAAGVADVMSELGRPYIISFVINRNGTVLDGTPLGEAIEKLDNSVTNPPTGYMVNCVYPSFICAEIQPSSLFKRLVGIQANSSSLDHSQLDGSTDLQQNPLSDWGDNMLQLNKRFGVKILGGCCGTDNKYLQYIADRG